MDEKTDMYKVEGDGIWDDVEIGKAGCYMFELDEGNPHLKENEEDMKKRFNSNRDTALRLADYMIEYPEIPEDAEYYKAWKDEIKKMRFED